jgi:AcrR family transcriptional regulator
MSQKDRILTGSLELFFRAGIKSVTMDDIAKHLAVSKKTIYQFFTDKNELVIALVTKKMQEDREQMEEIIAQPDSNVIEQLLKMMRCAEEILSRVNPILMHDLQKYHPQAWDVFQQFKAGVMIGMLERLLNTGIDQGYIRPDINVKVLARMRVNQVEMGFNTEIFPLSDFSPWSVQFQLMEHFNYGICTLEGYKLLEQYKNLIKHD